MCVRSLNKLLCLLCLVIAGMWSNPATLQAAVPSKYVILITIDGMRSAMVTDPGMPTPHLKMMKDNGIFIKQVQGVPPAATYPSHCTIVTGSLPVHHHIFYNSPFMENKDTTVSYWFADSVKASTIWQSAKKAHLTTASLFWPTTTGSRFIDYNIPEFWSVKRGVNQMEFLKDYCTPKGLLEEVQQNACGKLDDVSFRPGGIARDSRTAYIANYIMNKYHPNLMTIHLITTDYAQHATGLNSQWTHEAVGSVDNAIGLILENLKMTHKMDSTTIIVTGDHGFVDVNRYLAPNTWLVKAKLLSDKTGGKWKACFHMGGSTAFLYLQKKDDKSTLKKVEKILSSLPDSTKALFRVVNKKELEQLGADPKVVLALEPIKGVTVSNNRTGADVFPRKGGSHGYLSGIDWTTCLIYGAGIPKGKQIDEIRQIDIAPYIMYRLGVDFTFKDGTLPKIDF